MPNCQYELNKQLQGLAARLSQAENNITNHFVGVSLLVKGLELNPLTASAASLVSNIYNMVPGGFSMLQKLIDQITPIDFKKLMMLNAADLIDGMAAELGGMISNLVSSLESQIAALAEQAIAAAEAMVQAELAMAAALVSGIQAEIDAAAATLQHASDMVNSINNMMGKLQGLHVNLGGFMQGQADIANCKSAALKLSS